MGKVIYREVKLERKMAVTGNSKLPKYEQGRAEIVTLEALCHAYIGLARSNTLATLLRTGAAI